MAVSLPIRLDKRSGIPLYIQLAERIRLLVRQGTLRPSDPMPTVRELAVELGINANTVARVYRDLQSQGVLRLERGVGTSVAEHQRQTARPDDFREVEEKARRLIWLAQQAGMRPSELSQLIEARWQEVSHER